MYFVVMTNPWSEKKLKFNYFSTDLTTIKQHINQMPDLG